MPVPKALTESGWKAVVQKFKLKDTTLLKPLAVLAKLKEDDHAEQIKTLASMVQVANAVKRSKEAANPEVIKYLAAMITAAEQEQREVTKAKAQAGKEELEAQKKADAHDKAQEEQEKKAEAQAKAQEAKEKEEEKKAAAADAKDEKLEGAYASRLIAAMMAIKSAKGAVYEFVVCEGKPVAVMVARKITAAHKAELKKLYGGTRFLPVGTCTYENGKYNFQMDTPVASLARRIQESIRIHTGKKLPIICGGEEAGEEEEKEKAESQSESAQDSEGKQQDNAEAKKMAAKCHEAAEVWHGARNTIDANILGLKKSVQAHYSNHHPALLRDIDKGLVKLDAVLDKLDQRLAAALSKAGNAPNEAGREEDLKNAKKILAEYISYSKSEPLIDHLDSNPFGVKTNVRQTIADAVKHVQQTIG